MTIGPRGDTTFVYKSDDYNKTLEFDIALRQGQYCISCRKVNDDHREYSLSSHDRCVVEEWFINQIKNCSLLQNRVQASIKSGGFHYWPN